MQTKMVRNTRLVTHDTAFIYSWAKGVCVVALSLLLVHEGASAQTRALPEAEAVPEALPKAERAKRALPEAELTERALPEAELTERALPEAELTERGKPVPVSGPGLPNRDTTYCYRLDTITCLGLRRTKIRVLFQELSLQKDSTYCYENWSAVLLKEKEWLQGMGIFDSVSVTLVPLLDASANKPQQARLEIRLKERWFLFPYPLLRVSPYSIAYWLQQLNGNPRYLSYGLGLLFLSPRGLNDQLKLEFLLGNQETLDLTYRGPFKRLNSDQQLGYALYATYKRLRSQVYSNEENKAIQFIDNSLFSAHQYTGAGFFGELRLRHKLRRIHGFYTGFQYERIDSTLHALRPDFLVGGAAKQRRLLLQLGYRFVWDKRLERRYPRKGSLLLLRAEQLGLGLLSETLLTRLRASYALYLSREPRKWDLSFLLSGYYSFPFKQSFKDRAYLQEYSTFKGYQHVFIQGPSFLRGQIRLRRQLFSIHLPMPKKLIPFIKHVPFHAYPYIYANVAWVKSYPHEPQPYNDIALYGGGIGLDVVTLYELSFGIFQSFTPHGAQIGATISLGRGY